MRSLLLFIAASLPVFAGTVNCTNNSATDLGLINTALAAGGSTTVNGPCNLNGTAIQHVNGTILRGGTNATFTETTNGNVILDLAGSTLTVTGINFQGGVINANSPLTGFTFTHNTLANVTAGSYPGGGGFVSNGFHSSTITDNIIDNIFQGGYSDLDPPPYAGPINAACWQDYQGMDGTVISRNRFTRCGNDGFHINPGGSITATNANEFSYNYCAQTHRACYEIQAFMGSVLFAMKGNVAINYNAPFFDSFGYSMASVGTNMQFINNLGTLNNANCYGGVADFLEIFPVPSLVQGNVAQGLPTNFGSTCVIFGSGGSSNRSWDFSADNLGNGTGAPSNTDTYNNNIMCGNSLAPLITHENNPSGNHNVVETGDYKNSSSCPNAGGGLAVSNVGVPAFVSPPTSFPTFGSGTWNVTEISALPIKWVQFNVDGTTVATQEIQDVSSSFGSNLVNGVGDLKWLYHVTYNTTGLSSGSHVMQAIATDVLGAQQTNSSTFTTGSGTSPIASFSPTSVSFGNQQVSTASSPFTVVLTNTGTASLSISSISFTGTNSGDFSKTTTCGATLAIAASCPIAITFTPAATGARSANLSVADNASGSPQTVALTGTGTSGPPACSGLLLNCDFNAGTTPWVVNIAPYGSWVIDGSGPSGVNAAHISATSAVPISANIELLQDNVTLTIGQAYQLTFKANVSRTQQLNILVEQDVTPFTNYGLRFTPIITTGAWTTYSTTFVATAGAAGDTRFTVQMDNAINGDSLEFTDFSLTTITTSPVTVNSVGYIDHSVAQLKITSTTALSGNSGSIGRLRAAVAPATCVGGTGGLLMPQEIGPVYSTLSAPGFVLNMDIAGLSPSTAYNVCPELSYDGSATWTSGTSVAITTTALPAVHPAIPVAPATFDPSYPNTSGYAVYNVLSDCSDIGTAYTAAAARQASQGTVINIPAGTVCGTATTGNFAFAIKPVDVQGWVPANVNTSTSKIALGGTPTLTVGEGIRVGRSYNGAPHPLTVYPASTSCEFGQGLVTGQVYYVASVSTGNVVSLFCNDGVTPMVFTDQGLDTYQGFYWVPTVRNLQWIIVRSATPDSQLPPAGTAITPAWLPKMAILQSALTNLNVTGPGGAVLVMGDSDGNREPMTSHIHFGPGIEITHVDSPEAHTSSDPLTWLTLIQTYDFDDNIIFDRDYVHLLGTPNRNNDGFFWDGYQTAFIDSYFDNLTYFHSEYSGVLVTKTSGTTFTVASGIVNEGGGNVTVSGPRTVTVAGSGSGEIYVGLDMTAANAFTVWTPSGMTASCSGFTCANKIVSGTPNGSCNFSDAWQKDTSADPQAGTSGNPTVGQIGCLTVTSGAIGSVIHCADGNGTTESACPWVSAHATEGDSWMLASNGPGPYIFRDNFTSGAGLNWHSDDGGTTIHLRGDYTYYRNYFQSPFKYMYNPSNLSANPLSDGLGYYMRQPVEWKGGRRVQFNGNVCDGNWVEVEASAGCVLFTAVNGMGITDVDITNNSFMHQPGVTSMAFVTAGSNFSMPPPVLRYQFKNNFGYDIGSANFYAGRQALPPPGWLGEGPNATQDIRIEHNTIAGNIGTNPAVMWPFDTNTEGILVKNNIFYVNSTNQGLMQDGGEPNFGGCPSLTGKAFADCKFTPSYIWQNNLMMGNSQTPSAVAAAWPVLTNYFQSGSSSLFTVGWTNFLTPSTTPTNGNPSFVSLGLANASPWKAGSSGLNSHAEDVGADLDALAATQGIVTLVGLPNSTITSSSAVLAYVAPDSGVCYADISSTDPNVITSFTRFTDAGGARSRNLSLTSLSSQTLYWGRIECPGNAMTQKTFSFKSH